MATIVEGELRGSGCRLAVAVAEFNRDITDALLEGCLRTLERFGVRSEDITVARVPGAFELPLCCDRLARSGRYQAVVALGAVIRGETPHFRYVASACARGLARVALERGIPVAFGVLTTDTLAQARRRADRTALRGSDLGARRAAGGARAKRAPPSNKGAEAAEAALRMIAVLERI